MSDKVQIILNAGINPVLTKSTIQAQLNTIAPQLKLQLTNVTISPAAISAMKAQLGTVTAGAATAATRAARSSIQTGARSSVSVFDNVKQAQVQQGMINRLQTLQGTFSRLASNPAFTKMFDASKVANMNTQLGTMQTRISGITNNRMAQQFNTQFSQASQQVRNMSRQFSDAQPKVKGFFSELADGASKMLIWTAVGGAIFGAIHAIQSGVDSVIELNSTLAVFDMTMNITNEQMGELTTNAQEMALAMGTTVESVLGAANNYGLAA